MIRIEPLGTDIILPAFVIGYDVTDVPPDVLDAVTGRPGWFLTIDQQAGGLGMSYPSVAGVVLRLAANRDRGRRDLGDLIRGLKLMAEDPDLTALASDYPVLRRAVETHGGPYDRTTLSEFDRFLRDWLRLPPLAGGIEAFLRFAPCDPRDHLGGWKILSCTAAGEGKPIDADRVGVYDDATIGRLAIEEAEELSPAHLGELRRIGREEAPGVFLLWENSD